MQKSLNFSVVLIFLTCCDVKQFNKLLELNQKAFNNEAATAPNKNDTDLLGLIANAPLSFEEDEAPSELLEVLDELEELEEAEDDSVGVELSILPSQQYCSKQESHSAGKV